MTCAKKRVTAVLTISNGSQYHGSNDCLSPQEKCPRLPSEGYKKCESVCQQPSHAEIDAINQCLADGYFPHNGHMIVNHHRVCDNCQDVMTAYEITWTCTESKP